MTTTNSVKPQKAAVIGSALLFTTIATTLFCPHQYLSEFEEVAARRIAPIATFAPAPEFRVPPATAQEMITNLRKGGLPVSAIADAMRVERKTIYAWLSGGEVRNANIQRASFVHALLTGVSGVDARNLYRFWNTALDGKKTLRDLMTAENIDESTTRSALDNLRPAALRSMVSERKISRQGPTNAILDEIPEAGANG